MDATSAFKQYFVGCEFRTFIEFEKKLEHYMHEFYVIWSTASSKKNHVNRKLRMIISDMFVPRHKPKRSTSSGRRLDHVSL